MTDDQPTSAAPVDCDPLAYVEAATKGLTRSQVLAVQAFLVGVFSSYVDPDAPPLRMTPARWRRYVAAAIAEATTEGDA